MAATATRTTPLWKVLGLEKLFEALPAKLEILGHPQILTYEVQEEEEHQEVQVVGIYSKLDSPYEFFNESTSENDTSGVPIVALYRLGDSVHQKSCIGWMHKTNSNLNWWVGTISSEPGRRFTQLACVRPKLPKEPSIDTVIQSGKFGWVDEICEEDSVAYCMLEPSKVPKALSRLANLRAKAAKDYVKVASREDFSSDIDCLESAIINMMRHKSKDQKALQSCAAGCKAAIFSDISLEVADKTSVPANKKLLMEKSRVFKAMLADRDDGLQMKEASTGIVKLDHAEASTVKSILALLHTDCHVLNELDLDTSDMLNVISQAAEWQLTGVMEKVLQKFIDKISTVDASLATYALQLADKHKQMEASTKLWTECWSKSVKHLAKTCDADFHMLKELPFNALLEVIHSDELNTDMCEGKVLKVVVQWAKKEGRRDKTSELLKAVRFPFISATRLMTEFKEELAFVRECGCGDVLDELHGEAVHMQLQCMHKRNASDAILTDDNDAKRRMTKRTNSGAIPALSHSELAKAMAGIAT